MFRGSRGLPLLRTGTRSLLGGFGCDIGARGSGLARCSVYGDAYRRKRWFLHLGWRALEGRPRILAVSRRRVGHFLRQLVASWQVQGFLCSDFRLCVHNSCTDGDPGVSNADDAPRIQPLTFLERAEPSWM